MSSSQYRAFRQNVEALVAADDRIDLFEWCLHRILDHHLGRSFGLARPRRVHYYALSRLTEPCEVLLSVLAHVGHEDENAARRAFAAGAGRLQDLALRFRPLAESRLRDLDEALNVLTTVAPRPKQRLVEACAACIAADREIIADEAEVFRAIADTLGCPVPPLLPGQPLV
jgi:hypothetical protein